MRLPRLEVELHDRGIGITIVVGLNQDGVGVVEREIDDLVLAFGVERGKSEGVFIESFEVACEVTPRAKWGRRALFISAP